MHLASLLAVRSRRGTVLPMLAICLFGLFGFTALAIDIGVLAVSRTDCQNAADIAALIGTRTLNNKPTASNNDLKLAVKAANTATTDNVHMNAKFHGDQVKNIKIEAGQFLYNAGVQRFQVSTWTDVTSNQTIKPSSGSWTAMRVTISFSQPTFFAKVFGYTSMPTGAIASAVYRPRDTAFVLDMTGSMAYASQFNYNGQSLNPDNLVPYFGHYLNVQDKLIASTNQANGDGEAISRNNYTITTPGGLPIVRDFYFDISNAANPTNLAYPVVQANLRNAFHRWSPPESGANPTTYTPPTYNFSGYDSTHKGTESTPKGPTPAPSSFKTMTDASGIPYVGDRWRRADGSINKTDTTWATGAATTKMAANAIELLGYNVSGSSVRGGTSGTTEITTVDKFRDVIWEANGYDLDIVDYRAKKGNNGPMNPASYTVKAAAETFKGFSMGPGYWGKTFFIWPPDPRAPQNQPGSGSYVPGDWRRRYFLNRSSGAFDPQVDNNTNDGNDSGNIQGINEVLLNSGSGLTVSAIGSTNTPNWRINYANVLKWIKSGPQTVPPNLRAGRILYYSSIPDDVNVTGTTQQDYDKIFWKNYIDYTLGWNFTNTAFLYGNGDSWSSGSGARNIYQNDLTAWTGPSSNWTSAKPYMRYNDSPNRPRLHFWFGPLSMMDFIGYANNTGNWMPGTCHEAQCWQLKAGVNSVIDDVRNNRPNDYIGMVMFAADHYNAPRVELGQNYNLMKNALFYPKSLLLSITSGNTTTEIRPYTSSFGGVSGDEIPNANGSTDPNTGLVYAFNLLSPSTRTATTSATVGGYGTLKGRRGASKVVIVETDGVPNTNRGYNSTASSLLPEKWGYDTYYKELTWSSGNKGNGDATSMSQAVKVAGQIVKPMATSATSGTDSGLSLPNAPARVYPIGFGDLFDTTLAPSASFRNTAKQFLANIAAAGNTGVAGASTIPDIQIITGPYDQRITRLKDCMERIFETGVSVALVE